MEPPLRPQTLNPKPYTLKAPPSSMEEEEEEDLQRIPLVRLRAEDLRILAASPIPQKSIPP